MVTSIAMYVSQARLDSVIKIISCVTGIKDNVVAKGDSEINHDIAVLSLLEAAQNNNLKFKPGKI